MKGKAFFETKLRLYEVVFDDGSLKEGWSLNKKTGERTEFEDGDLKVLMELANASVLTKRAFDSKLEKIKKNGK
jgi:hypothetical protein